jgi:predicted phage baseplate assembly protein
MHPDFPCFSAPGMITVIVLPYLPHGQPMPSPGLLQAVNAYLRPRRVIGTRVEAVAPTYLDVAVQATVQSLTGSNRTSLQQAIVTALNSFLDPLIGGPAETGWPFGRDVYRSEIMKVIDAVPGVDYVASLALLADGGQAQCGNVCVGPITLVAAGTHQITVL